MSSPTALAESPVATSCTARQALFAAYMENRLDMTSLIFELDTLQQKDIKARGVIYTPPRVIAKLLQVSELTPFDSILEPSCGHGAIVFALLDHAKQSWGLEGKKLLNWFESRVVANDLSQFAIAEFKELLAAYWAKEGLDVAPRDMLNIFAADTLFHDYGRQFSLCIGNPPYIRTKNLDELYLAKLRAHYPTCKTGNVDIYYAFIEFAASVAKHVSFITPSSFLANASAKRLRQLITPRLSTLVDFKEKLVFEDARTYTCIFNLGPTNSATYGYATDFDAPLVERDKATTSAVAENGAQVLSGLATLADSVFRVEKIGRLFFSEFNGVRYEIEEGLVVPYFKLTKLQDGPQRSFMLYPYDSKKTVLPEDVIAARYPKAYLYLQQVKVRLAERDKGCGQYEAWYAYGRKQGLHAISSDTVLAVPQMIGKACQPRVLDIAALLKRYKTIVFSAGYLIPVTEANTSLCNFVLGPAQFAAFLREEGKPWPGKDEPYYSLTAKQLRQVVLAKEGA